MENRAHLLQITLSRQNNVLATGFQEGLSQAQNPQFFKVL